MNASGFKFHSWIIMITQPTHTTTIFLLTCHGSRCATSTYLDNQLKTDCSWKIADMLVEEKLVKFPLFLLRHMMPLTLPATIMIHLLMITYQNVITQFSKREKEGSIPLSITYYRALFYDPVQQLNYR